MTTRDKMVTFLINELNKTSARKITLVNRIQSEVVEILNRLREEKLIREYDANLAIDGGLVTIYTNNGMVIDLRIEK